MADYYTTNSERSFLGHMSLGVKSYDSAKPFYTAIFAPFGVKLVYDSPEDRAFGFGTSDKNEVVTIFERGFEAQAPGPGTHFAFNAPSRKAVKEFWEAAMANGAEDYGAPGLRADYGDRYYAAYIIDPDGHRLEAVIQQTDE